MQVEFIHKIINFNLKNTMNTLDLNFLNVGHGDCTVIKFPSGRISMIDINNAFSLDDETSNEYFSSTGKAYDIQLTNPIEWLNDNGINSLFRFTCTHPDMDHLTGISALNNELELLNFWDVQHDFENIKDTSDFTDEQLEDWNTYLQLRQSTENPKSISPTRDDDGNYWTDDGIHILSPNQELIDHSEDKEDANHLSYVVMIKHGNIKVYLCGDATDEATFPNMIEHYGEDFFKKKDGEIVILKAAHHGRDSGYNQKFVELLQPDVVVVSVGKKPSTDASNKYRNYCDNVWSTRFKGNINIQCSENDYVANFEYDR